MFECIYYVRFFKCYLGCGVNDEVRGKCIVNFEFLVFLSLVEMER